MFLDEDGIFRVEGSERADGVGCRHVGELRELLPCEGYVELPGCGVGAEFLDEVEERVGESSSCLFCCEGGLSEASLSEFFGERLGEEEREARVLLDDGEEGSSREGEESCGLQGREGGLVRLVGEEGSKSVDVARA